MQCNTSVCVLITIVVSEAMFASHWLKEQEKTIVLPAGWAITPLLFARIKKDR